MASVVHVVTTRNFAGAERYACDVARETVTRGWEATVVGGDPGRITAELDNNVRWMPGATAAEALRSLARLGRQDILHAHMTLSETVAVVARPLHRAPVISTRHFASRRGSSRAGRLMAPLIGRGLARQIAVSRFVAHRLERTPDAIIHSGVPPSPTLWRKENRTVLVLQRLEREKDTLTALQAWENARLANDGWKLRIVGSGAERNELEAWATSHSLTAVEFAGWTSDVAAEYAQAGVLLATAPAEPFGLVVVEAMAAGVPVVATASGGHLETVGRVPGVPMFAPGDVPGAASALRSILPDERRYIMSETVRRLAQVEFTTARHVDQLLEVYKTARSRTPARAQQHETPEA